MHGPASLSTFLPCKERPTGLVYGGQKFGRVAAVSVDVDVDVDVGNRGGPGYRYR